MDPVNSGVSFLSVISSDPSDSGRGRRAYSPYQQGGPLHEEVRLLPLLLAVNMQRSSQRGSGRRTCSSRDRSVTAAVGLVYLQ